MAIKREPEVRPPIVHADSVGSTMFIGRWLSAPLSVIVVISSLSLYWTSKSSRNASVVQLKKELARNSPTLFESKDHLYNWPPLSDIIWKVNENKTNIIGDVQWLLDYAIVGHSKTGTTDLQRWLTRHPEVQGHVTEVRSLFHHNPGELVELMYNLSSGTPLIRGYKHPLDIVYDYSVDYLAQYWPSTRLIVGVRSPIKWMESWYNFRVRMRGKYFHGNGSASDPLSMMGRNLPFQMFFHRHLALLGKTNGTDDPHETALLNTLARQMFPKRPYVPNKIFLYDVSQPFDKNESRRNLFREDLQRFIGLQRPLPPIRIANTSRNFHFALDICEDRYIPLRKDILKVSKAASEWISKYFLDHPDVTVSSRDHFKVILETWLHDPCDKGIDGEVELQKNGEPSDIDSNGTSVGSTWEALGRPALADLVENNFTVRGNASVEFLLDFGLVGHAKTATTSLLSLISAHKDVEMFNEEIHHLTFGRTGLFVSQMYSLPAGSHFRRGYKAPNDISLAEPRSLLQKYFPNADLVVGLRHPIQWFESFYNYNSRRGTLPLKPVQAYSGWNNLPYQIKFHVHLAAMGKTRPSRPDEFALLRRYIRNDELNFQRMNHRVFLYDVSQLFDKNETRNFVFREDLSEFLGLSSTLAPIELRNRSLNFHYAIDICEDQYEELRKDLMDFGKAASTWIRKYFLELPDVYVSSKDKFVQLLKTWDRDTCLVRT